MLMFLRWDVCDDALSASLSTHAVGKTAFENAILETLMLKLKIKLKNLAGSMTRVTTTIQIEQHIQYNRVLRIRTFFISLIYPGLVAAS